ncbi:CPCC family cysteine-rich protein [Massilia sp. CCM 9210]|uniref:CPCC family cysteine-rich protein n=1 Tax=Massilia scottii TaxID=3057166 RepID=UPI0027968D11|nr:CPCC family cysteine-rich protein [Massilia sp. CCM 9210]MDQ1813288.1 CPCC family cysteine-rich protein [Massilia sp. CCM 9210]
MTRNEAIKLLARRDLARLSEEKREALLLDWWYIDADDPEYDGLPDLLKSMMASFDVPEDPTRSIYDPLLQIALEYSYIGVVNTYLKSQTQLLGCEEAIEGDVEDLKACSCCGYRSLLEGGSYEICRVCFWEDDGTTECDRISAPNHMTLREARINFQRSGAVSDAYRQNVLPDGKDRYVSTIP